MGLFTIKFFPHFYMLNFFLTKYQEKEISLMQHLGGILRDDTRTVKI